MNQTWWRSPKDVDKDQLSIYSLPLDGSHLVVGPPGSGKTNVLLLRAVYLSRGGRPNFKVLTFSRSLVEFIRNGVRQNGKIPEDRIQTVAGWQGKLHFDLTGKSFSYPSGASHNDKRRFRIDSLIEVIGRGLVPKNYFDAILVDEAQDLWAGEVDIISRITQNMFFVGDNRQRIYAENEGLPAVRALGIKEHALKYHYRIGRRICRAADRILPDVPTLTEFCQYDEVALPSSVKSHECASRTEQMQKIVKRLETQLRAYPEEWIGVLTPTNQLLDEFEDFAQETGIGDKLAVHREGARDFHDSRPIIAMTVHSAKGTEFRAVHLFGAEEFGHYYRRELGFTLVTRAKTVVDLYFTGAVDGSLLAAFQEDRVPDPTEVF